MVGRRGLRRGAMEISLEGVFRGEPKPLPQHFDPRGSITFVPGAHSVTTQPNGGVGRRRHTGPPCGLSPVTPAEAQHNR